MPAYNASPFAAAPEKLTPGKPAYVLGSWNNQTSPTKFLINKVALTSNVATITGVIVDGNVPVVGALITVTKCPTNTEFNVTNIAVASVTIASDGTGTITYACTRADVAAVASSGIAIIPQPEVAEALVAGASLAVGLPYSEPSGDSGEMAISVTAIVTFPSLPTSVTVSLQGAVQNIDGEYQTVGTCGTVSGGAATLRYLNYSGKFNFYRLLVGTVTGGSSPTIIGKILV